MGGYKNYDWSRFYPACVSCGTTSIPHSGRGRCEKCADIVTDAERERLIAGHGSACDYCGIGRKQAKKEGGKDFCVMRNGKVLCRKCFQRFTFGTRVPDSASN
jgi:hypothetical protein